MSVLLKYILFTSLKEADNILPWNKLNSEINLYFHSFMESRLY